MPGRLCLVLLFCAALSGVAAAAESSRFQRTVEALQDADDALRREFASVALLELAEIYLAEADLADSEARDSEEAARLRAWSRAVEQFAAQLLLVQGDIELGLPVELRSYRHEDPSITVAGRTVFLAHPRHREQPAYEQSVLTRFCTGATCAALTAAANAGESPIPMSVGQVKPEWQFSEGGPVCRYRGLSVTFSARDRLFEQRALCQELMQEAVLLANELAWQQRHGVEVSWETLSLRATPGRPQHLVLLNEEGDSVLVTAPLIYSTAGLLPRLAPWLRSPGAGGDAPRLDLHAADMGWE